MAFTVGDILVAIAGNKCRSYTKAEILSLLGLSSGETFIKKYRTSDGTPVNNSIVLVADDKLFFPIGANEVWQFECQIFWSSTSAKLKFDFTGPAAPVDVKYGQDSADWYSLFAANPAVAMAFSVSLGVANPGASPTNNSSVVRGLIQNGANAGTVQLRIAQVSGIVEDTKVLNGSNLIAHQLA